MSAVTSDRRTALHSIKENRPMPKRLATIAATLGAALTMLLAVLPVASASAAEPWWQIVDGSRPSNLWEATDNVQEITAEKGFSGALAVEIKVEGNLIGCLGAGSYEGFGPDEICSLIGIAPEATETAEELEALLEGSFGAGAVEVTGGPATENPLNVTVFGRSAPKIEISDKPEVGGAFGSGGSQVLSPGGSGRLVITITNLGDAPVDATETPVTITDELPEGVEASGVQGFAGVRDLDGPLECEVTAADLVTCSFEGTLPPYEALEVEAFVSLLGSPPVAGAPGKVTVVGGNVATASAAQPIVVSPQETQFGLERFSTQLEEEGGTQTIQAGAHPFQVTNTTQYKADAMPGERAEGIDLPTQTRNLRFPLPAGLVGNATVNAKCSLNDFYRPIGFINSCPATTAIGVAAVTLSGPSVNGVTRRVVPVFNLPPNRGEPARFGLTVLGYPALIDTAVDPDDEYRLIASVSNVTQLVSVVSSTVVLWGTPGDPRHDPSRGWTCVERLEDHGPCERPPALGESAFLRAPVACQGALAFDVAIEPWNATIGSVIDSASFAGAGLHGCNKVPFDPKIAASPSSKLAEAPSGLSFSVNMPNSGLLSKDAIAEGQPKKVEVELPEGMTLNPSAAEGLAVCTQADYNREKFDSRPGEGCPDASKLGNVEIDTPLIEENPKGSLYIAKSYDNPFNSLLAVYIIARSPERGILVKLPVKIEPNEKTGQLIATLDDSPQTPFSSFDMSFREGGRAPLVTPPACGDYEIKARFVPWSAQDPDNPAPNEVITRTSSFEVERGVDGGACPPGGVPPFNPDFEAGSINNDAGSHTDFNMRLIREDGEQNMTRFSAVLPPGVLGKLSGIDKCPDSAIAKAKSRTGPQGGHEEIADPSCPANSKIGRSLVGAGVGSVLTRVPGEIYLGGSFNGAPLSVIAVTPVVAGPFDAGTVVVQEALTLNPKTAEVEVDGSASDPIPHILKGIPAKLRDLRVYVDRPNFIINPTSCDESSARSTLFGSYLDLFSTTDDVPVDLATRFQAANCLNLGFKPKLNLNLKGGTRRGGHPGLKAIYRPRAGDANVKGLVVRLPRSAFLDQAHIRTICTRVQFAADNCPKGAQYGYIRAWSPLLDEPLQGPVWLRSSNHKLPDMVFDLHGLVDVEVATRIDSARGGIRATVESAPDAPLSKVELKMQGGKKGLIVNSRNLCGAKSRANVQFSGHNGKEARANPVMRADGCKKKRKARHSRVR